MDILHERAAGMDISKKDAKVCVRTPGARKGTFAKKVSTYGSTTNEVLRLRADLQTVGVTIVVMEATGDYWKPFFFILDEMLQVELVNAKQAKNIPGRKSDVSDATWLAELAAHGLLRASFVPPEPIRQLRDLTRTRTHLTQERTREYSRMENILQAANIKLSSVASNLTTKSVRHILDALVAGTRDPHILAALVEAKMVKKTPALVEALTGRFNAHHAFMVKFHLDRIDHIDEAITELETQIDLVMTPFRPARDMLTEIPGISVTGADVIIAEIGDNMDVFATPGHLASWAGVCPGQNESAGRIKSTHTRPGDSYLKGTLGIAAMAASRSKKTYLSAKYRRIKSHTGSLKAIVAIEHTMLVIIWHMLADGVTYQEKGPDYYNRQNPLKTRRRAIRQLRNLGYDVELTPTQAA